MKEYLLESERRLELSREAGGEIRTIAGTQNLDQLLDDRTFVCLHYHYSPGKLEPCKTTNAEGLQLDRQGHTDFPRPPPPAPTPAIKEDWSLWIIAHEQFVRYKAVNLQDLTNFCQAVKMSSVVCSYHAAYALAQGIVPYNVVCSLVSGCCKGLKAVVLCRPSIQESNLQIGVSVRRGVGGTCPARLAGRQLARQGLFSALLDSLTPEQTPANAVPPEPTSQSLVIAATPKSAADFPAKSPPPAISALASTAPALFRALEPHLEQTSSMLSASNQLQRAHQAAQGLRQTSAAAPMIPPPLGLSASCGASAESSTLRPSTTLDPSALPLQSSASKTQPDSLLSVASNSQSLSRAMTTQALACTLAQGASTVAETTAAVRQVSSATELASRPPEPAQKPRAGQCLEDCLSRAPYRGEMRQTSGLASSRSDSLTPAKQRAGAEKGSTGLSAIAMQWMSKEQASRDSGHAAKPATTRNVSSPTFGEATQIKAGGKPTPCLALGQQIPEQTSKRPALPSQSKRFASAAPDRTDVLPLNGTDKTESTTAGDPKRQRIEPANAQQSSWKEGHRKIMQSIGLREDGQTAR